MGLCAVLSILVGLVYCRQLASLSFANRFIQSIKPRVVLPDRPAIPVAKNRGTTVPTVAGSRAGMKRTSATSFRDISRVDPRDPYTFGYIKLGKVLGAHGVQGEVKVLLEPGTEESIIMKDTIIYVKKPNRRTPRPVRVVQCRRQGNTESQQDVVLLVELEGVQTRSMAEAFTRYELYAKSKDRSALKIDEYTVREVVGLQCYLLQDMAAVQQWQASQQSCQQQALPITNAESQKHTQQEPSLRSDITASTICVPQPIAVVVGVVPPGELCESPAAAKLMHAQLELRILSPDISSIGKKVSNSVPRKPRGPPQHCLIPLVPSIVPMVDLQHRCLFLDPPPGLLELTYVLDAGGKGRAVKGYLPATVGSLSLAEREYLTQRCTALPISTDTAAGLGGFSA
jgi:ribosomal 30S subunit maturation factor RimM